MATREEMQQMMQEMFERQNEMFHRNKKEMENSFDFRIDELKQQMVIVSQQVTTFNDNQNTNIDSLREELKSEFRETIDTRIRETEERSGFSINVVDEKVNTTRGESFTVMEEDFSEILDDELNSFEENCISFDKDNDDNDSYDSYDSDFDDSEIYDDNLTDMDDLEIFDIICECEDSFSFEYTYIYDNCFVSDDSLNENGVLDVTDELSDSLYLEGNSLKKHTVCNASSTTAIQCRKCGDMSAKILLDKDLMANVVGNDEELPRMLWDPGVDIINDNWIVS